jgi:D-sedoheptulose 7-phosphate isomerase
MEPGDLVLAMSVSGNSPNLVKALEYARDNGGRTIAWTGFDGGRLAALAELSVHFPSTRDEYGPVEDMFAMLVHIVAGYLAMKRGRNLHH